MIGGPRPDTCSDMLLRELNHRFFNSLQVIASMTGGLLRDQPHGHRAREVERIQDRLAQLGRLHRLLAEPMEQSQTLLAACRLLCRTLTQAFDRPDARVLLMISSGPEDPMQIRGLMLLIAELVTNALKHASAGMPATIRITLDCREQGYRLNVRSEDLGAEGPCAPPRIAAHIVRSLGGTLDAFRRKGFHVRVLLPHG
jgi:chemotaxis family two-component system sensor kinase Cph1